MSRRNHSPAAPFARRHHVLAAAVASMLEQLETRSHFSATPTANPGGVYTVAEGQSVLVSGLGSTDSDGTVQSYQWDTNYDATKGFKTRVTTGSFTFHADTTGTRTVALRVVDNSGDVSGVATTTINMTDVAPTLTLTAPSAAAEGAAVNASWSYTDPSAADVVTGWSVNWGDGVTSTYDGAATGSHHVYDEDGSYTIALTATQANQANLATTVSQPITITDVTPIVVATAPRTTLDEGETAIAYFSSPNRAGTLDGWSIDWGDGQVDQYDNTRSTANHVYADNGNYAAVITAQEPDGGSGSSTINYTVNNVAPTVAETNVPATGLEGTALTVNSTVTDPGVNDTQAYGWTVYRDGQHFMLPGNVSLIGQSFTFTPTDNGSYVARLTVTDKDGGATTVNSSPIVVANVAPTATITGTPVSAINEGASVNLTAVPADAGAEDTVFTYAWSVTKDGAAFALPGGTVLTNAGFHFVPTDNGSYVATVVVTDKDGGNVSASTAAITVNNVAPTPTITGTPATANEGGTVNAASTVTDPGTLDTQGYSWSVEKQTSSGTTGTVTTTGGRGELNTFDWGSSFTLTSRMQINSAMLNTTGQLFYDYNQGRLYINVAKSPTGVTLSISNGGNVVSTVTNAIPLNTTFDLAVSYDGTNGASKIYVNGAQAAAGTLPTGLAYSTHTHFAEGVYGTFDQLGEYHSVLSPTDVASLHGDTAIATAPYELWNFDNAAGTNTATTTGINGRTISIWNTSVTYGPATTWVPYVLPAGLNTTASTFAFVPTDNGTYRTKLTVTDNDGGVGMATGSNIVVANVAPTAVLTGDAAGNEGTALSYSVAAGDVGAADVASLVYAWSVKKGGVTYALPGGTVTNASTFGFAPGDNGAYVVSVVVTDKDGGTVTKTQSVTVANVAPDASITGAPSTSPEGTAIALGSTASDVSPVDTTAGLTYLWSVAKDGVAYPVSAGTNVGSGFTFTPTDNGSYVVSLVVSDKDGGTKSISTSAINVTNVAPTATVSGEPGAAINEGDPVALTAAATDVGADDVAGLGYAWTIKKDGVAWTPLAGTVLNTPALSFVPTDNGTYVATVTVTDKDGGFSRVDSLPIVANNVPPAVSVAVPATGLEGSTVSSSSTITDAGAADTHTSLWTVTKSTGAVAGRGTLLEGTYGDGAYSYSYPVVGAQYTFTARLKIGATRPSFGHMLMLSKSTDADRLAFSIQNTGSAYSVYAISRVNNAYQYAQCGSVPYSTFESGFADVAITVDTQAQATQIYINGVAQTMTSQITAFPSGLNNIAIGESSHGEYDQAGFYNSALSSGDIAALHNDQAIATTPADLWAMDETVGSTTVHSTGSNGTALTLGYGAVLTTPVLWAPVTLAAGSNAGDSFDFTPRDNGVYRVQLAVTDKDGATTTRTSDITVANVAPTPTITGDSAGNENAPISLNVAANDPGLDDTQTYLWSVTKNGVNYTTGLGATNASSFTFTPNLYGTYVVTATVTDKDGGVGTITKTIAANNVAPTATITGGLPTGPIGEGSWVTLTGTGSDVPAETGLTYNWSVTRRNGQAFTLPVGTDTTHGSFTFQPTDNANYRVTLAVTDSGGLTGTATTGNIVVTNANPAATMNGVPGGTTLEGTAVPLSVTAADPGAEDTLTYLWTVTKNGVAFALPQGTDATHAAFSFTPNDNGSWVATCVVTDNDGGATSVNSGAMVVTNVAPTVVINRQFASGAINEGDVNFYTAAVTDPGTADTFTYLWTATKNGQPYALDATATQQQLKFVADDQGVYTLNVTVTDKDSGTGTATTGNITVLNANPTVTRDTVDATGTEGVAFNFDAGATDPGVHDVLNYTWTIFKPDATTDTVVGTPLSLTDATAGQFGQYTPADNGNYYVKLTVTDQDGGTRYGTTHLVTVADAAPTITSVTVPATGNEGAWVNASVAATDVAADSGSLAYAWTVTKDGQPFTLPNTVATNGTNFAFIPTDNGSYVLRATVTDKDGGVSYAERTVAVANVAPIVSIGGDSTGTEGSPAEALASALDPSSADNAAGLVYAWSVLRNGQPYALPIGTVTNTQFLNFTPADNGTYAANLTVTDKDGGHTTKTQTIVVANVAPVPTIHGVPTSTIDEGSVVNLSAGVTDPGVNDTFTYAWRVTDANDHDYPLPAGTVTNASAFSFVPGDQGTYSAWLVVTDNDGAAAGAISTPIMVRNVPPTGVVSGPATGVEGSPVTMTVAANDAGSADMASLAYAWTVTKDGNAISLPGNAVTNLATFAYTPADQGAYVLTCTVTDKDGGSTAIDHNLTVTNVAPTVAITGLTPVNGVVTGSEGSAITVGSAVTDPGVNDVLTYGWTVYKDGQVYALPDGTVVNGHGLTFTPQDNGNYAIRLTVNDQDGGSTTVNTQTIAVANIAPAAAITGDTTGTEGQPVSLTSTASDVGPLDQAAGFTYAWTVTRGNTVVATGSNATLGFTPSVHGTYGVRLAVTDKDGSTTTTTSAVTVANLPPANLAITGSLSGMSEGQTAAATIAATDAPGDVVMYAWQVLRGQSVFASGTGANVHFIAGRGNYTLVVSATDTANTAASRSYDFSVANVAPTATLTGPSSAVLPGASAVFGLTASDVPAQQALSITWDYGDGSTPTTAAYTGNQSLTTSHAYAVHGTYTVTATINDGADSTVVTRVVNVSEAMMVTDPMNSAKTALVVYGSAGDDVINVSQQSNGKYGVTFNGTTLGTNYAPTGRIYVYGNGGSNTINVDGTTNAVVVAGTGASSVTTGAGNDIIVGSPQADRLNGGDGRDIVIGGNGADILHGNAGDDLEIAGGTSWMNDLPTLNTVFGKWSDSTSSAPARRTGLQSLFASKLLIGDTGGNQVFGESGNDWMVINSNLDKIKDLQTTDLVN